MAGNPYDLHDRYFFELVIENITHFLMQYPLRLIQLQIFFGGLYGNSISQSEGAASCDQILLALNREFAAKVAMNSAETCWPTVSTSARSLQ